MNIYIQRNDETYGPFSRDEVIRYLLHGEFSEEDLACTEENQEARPLKDLLKEQAPALFSLELLEEKQERINSEPPPVIPVASARKSATIESPSWQFPTRAFVAALGVFLVVGITSYFVFKPAQSPVAPPPTASVSAATPLAKESSQPQANPQPAGQETAQVPPDQAPATDLSAHPVLAGVPQPSTPAPEQMPAPAVNMDASQQAAAKAQPATDASPAAANEDSPKGPMIRVHDFPLATSDEIKKAEFYYAETATNANTILVLCLPPNGNAKVAVENTDWQQFATTHGLTLAAVSFSSDTATLKAGRGYTNASLASGNLLASAVEKQFGPAASVVLYGAEGGASFVSSFVNWRPEMVKAWGVYNNESYEPPSATKSNPPGVIACDEELLKRGKKHAQDYFLAGRHLSKPWTWAPVAGNPKFRRKWLDTFFRHYVEQCLAMAPGSGGVWIGMEDRKVFSKLDLMTKPDKAMWLPDASLVEHWSSLTSDVDNAGGPTIIKKSVATLNPLQKELRMYLRLPPGAKTGKDVDGVLAYCTWDQDEAKILKTLAIQGNEKLVALQTHHTGALAGLIDFADTHNLAVLTWGTVTSWNMATDGADLAKQEERRTQQTFGFLANAWERGVAEFGKETGLPTKDYLLYGISRGAQWAHRLALQKPEYFLAVHIHISSSFDVPNPAANEILWLITTGEQDYGYPGGIRFYKECSRLGYPIIFKAGIGLAHDDSTAIDGLGLSFFDYALSVKDDRLAYDKQREGILLKKAPQTQGPWIASFQAPDYFGDLLNQDCYPKDKAEMIPATLRVPLPTKSLADAWNK